MNINLLLIQAVTKNKNKNKIYTKKSILHRGNNLEEEPSVQLDHSMYQRSHVHP